MGKFRKENSWNNCALSLYAHSLIAKYSSTTHSLVYYASLNPSIILAEFRIISIIK